MPQLKEESKVNFKTAHICILLTALFGLLAYFEYGGVHGVAAILLLCVIYWLLLTVSIVPFIGWLIQAWLMRRFTPNVITLTGIAPTWLTDLVFWSFLGLGIVVSAISSLIVILALQDR